MVKAAKCKLAPTLQQADALRGTLRAFVEACNRIALFCNSCGVGLDADINAARNIRQLAAQGRFVNTPEVTP